jgi:hypothetical protein
MIKFAPNYMKHASFTVLAACATLAFSAQLSQNLTSSRAQTDRSKALDTVAKHSLVDNCMTLAEPLLIGDVIELFPDSGKSKSKSTTSCAKDPNGNIGYAAYLGNQLQVQYVYTPKELQAQISVIKKGGQ